MSLDPLQFGQAKKDDPRPSQLTLPIWIYVLTYHGILLLKFILVERDLFIIQTRIHTSGYNIPNNKLINTRQLQKYNMYRYILSMFPFLE